MEWRVENDEGGAEDVRVGDDGCDGVREAELARKKRFAGAEVSVGRGSRGYRRLVEGWGKETRVVEVMTRPRRCKVLVPVTRSIMLAVVMPIYRTCTLHCTVQRAPYQLGNSVTSRLLEYCTTYTYT